MAAHPLTVGQSRQLDEDLLQIQTQATGIEALLKAAYGYQDERAVRASEVSAALKRLQWALDRAKLHSDTASA
jgi:hypothetical protein